MPWDFVDAPPPPSRAPTVWWDELSEHGVLGHFQTHAVNKAISDLRMAKVSKPV